MAIRLERDHDFDDAMSESPVLMDSQVSSESASTIAMSASESSSESTDYAELSKRFYAVDPDRDPKVKNTIDFMSFPPEIQQKVFSSSFFFSIISPISPLFISFTKSFIHFISFFFFFFLKIIYYYFI